MPVTPSTTDWKRVAPYFGANVLFGAGLWAHAFLYNFYLQALGFDESVMGLAAAALTAGGLTALAPSGLVVDRLGPRWAYIGAVALCGSGLFAGAFVESAAGVYGAAFVAGMGAAAWRVTMAPVLIAIAEGGVRARAFSWNVALLVGSGALWTAGAGWASDWIGAARASGELGGLRGALAAGAIVTLCAAPAFLTVRLPPIRPEASSGPGILRALRGFALPRRLIAFVAVLVVWQTAGGLVLPFFNLFFQRSHGMSVSEIGSLFAVVQIATAVGLLGAGELAGRVGPVAALVRWSLSLAPALGALALGGPLAAAIVLYALVGLVPPATNPLADQILLEEADAHVHGVASSWRNAATELSGFIGAGAGGYLLAELGFTGLYFVAGAVALAGAAGLALWCRPPRLTSG